jgi:hypothetical protein
MVAELRSQVDNGLLTIVVSDEEGEQYFIGEALAAGVGLSLIHHYLAGLLEGLVGTTFEELGKAHGAKARAFLGRLRSRTADDAVVAEERTEVAAAVASIKGSVITPEARLHAQTVITDELRLAGATTSQIEMVNRALDSALARGLDGA